MRTQKDSNLAPILWGDYELIFLAFYLFPLSKDKPHEEVNDALDKAIWQALVLSFCIYVVSCSLICDYNQVVKLVKQHSIVHIMYETVAVKVAQFIRIFQSQWAFVMHMEAFIFKQNQIQQTDHQDSGVM